jgi:hypothetical protein
MAMAANRAISQLVAGGYPWIGCECCKGTVWVPFRMIREKLPMLNAMTRKRPPTETAPCKLQFPFFIFCFG